MSKLTEKEFGKLQDETVDQVMLYTNHLIEEGIKSLTWTFTNDLGSNGYDGTSSAFS